MEITQEVYLALGSNSGNREEHILNAITLLNVRVGKFIIKAGNFENEAQGFESDTLFLNTCVQIQTKLSPTNLLAEIKRIEKDLGRLPKKNEKYESRSIDIDIILYSDTVISTEELTIPHLHFRSRDFVLVPLTEIAPNVIDPLTNLTIQQLYELFNK
jgi:2-amino-4-hydroxy-6-hydroxymethyldihydropteridine diphosphokinase